MATPDFYGMLSGIGDTLQQNRVTGARERTLADLGRGAIDQEGAARQLLATGDVHGAMTLANLGNNQRDFAFRQQESDRAQSNANRAYDLQERVANAGLEGAKIQPGWEKTPTGLRPVQGGPADPVYVKSLRDAQEKPHDLHFGDIAKLTEEGGKFASVNGFIQNFKPEYAGKPFGTGTMSNYLARNLPSELTGETERAAASYWQNYDRYKNVVRNDLFGSALTATEQAAFEKADINPGMNPDIIGKNLAEQQRVLQGAMKRKAASLIASKYNPQAISEAYGIDLKQLGVGQPSATAQSTPTSQPSLQPAPARTAEAKQPARLPAGVSPAQAKKMYPSGTPIILPDGREGIVP